MTRAHSVEDGQGLAEDDPSSLPLAGVRVLQSGRSLATAYCGRVLRDLGATVVMRARVERDPADTHQSTYLTYLDSGKEAIDIAATAPLEGEMARLDVVICDGWWGAAEANRLRAQQPDLIVVTTSDFGLHGPDALTPATEFTLQAQAGIVALQAHGDRPPVKVGVPLSELVGGLAAANGVMTALLSRDHISAAIDVDVSRFEALLSLLSFPWMTDEIAGHAPYISPVVPSPGIEKCADGWICIVALTPDQWTNFKKMAGVPELDDERFDSVTDRFELREQLTPLLRRFTTRHRVEELTALGRQFRVPMVAAARPDAVAMQAPFAARDTFVASASGDFRQPRPPYRLRRGGSASGSGSRTAGPKSSRQHSASQPLAGIRVVELGLYQAGPLVTRQLALLGADVIKVEAVSRPDLSRFAGGPPGAARRWELGASFLGCNVGKRAITADMNDPRGLDVLTRLIKSTDVVVENYAPRTLDSRDLGFDGIHELRPDAVVLRMPAWGLDGPWADQPGFTYTANAIAGIAELTGYPDGEPLLSGAIIDPTSAMFGALAVLVALFDRARTGCGYSIEMALCDVAVQLSAAALVDASSGAPSPTRAGNRDLDVWHQDAYRCADGRWIAVSLLTLNEWDLLARHLHEPDDQPAASALEWHCARANASVILEEFRRLGLAVSEVVDGRTATSSAQLRARGSVYQVDHSVAGPLSYLATPARIAALDPAPTPIPAPLFGQHNDDILAELGFGAEAISDMRAAGVIGEVPFALPARVTNSGSGK